MSGAAYSLLGSVLEGWPVVNGIIEPDEALPDRPRCCGYCGYDLRDVPAERCPECGKDPSTWRLARDSRLRRWQAVHAFAACIPLLYLAATNVSYLAARVSLGEWPGPWNHPGATTTLHTLNALFTAVLSASLIAPGIVWIFTSTWMMHKPASALEVRRILVRIVLVCIGCWTMAFVAVWLDPIGAFEWMLD